MDNNFKLNSNNDFDITSVIFKYLGFWPYFLISISLGLSSAYVYLKYSQEIYTTTTKIKILDDAMDSDMALPTAMTIFNRSTINLENEIEVLKSYRILEEVVNLNKYNIGYYDIGLIKTRRNHESEWLDMSDYTITHKINNDSINQPLEFIFNFSNDGFVLNQNFPKNPEKNKIHNIKGFDTKEISELIPFDLSINKNSIKNVVDNSYKLYYNIKSSVILELTNSISIKSSSKNSDILEISLLHVNPKIAKNLINTLSNSFDKDGIRDRQLVFKQTIDFVDSRFGLLKDDLNKIEQKKQNFKESNSISFIKSDALISNSQQKSYEIQILQIQTQLELSKFLAESLNDEYNTYIPINIGIDNENINYLIREYNNTITEKMSITSAGSNNIYLLNIDKQLNNFFINLTKSIQNYSSQLNISLKQLENKELEYSSKFSSIPENEKLLRSINREQEIKEALFLLLLQKREEALINFAVTKPSIKIIDEALTQVSPISPKRNLIYLSAFTLSFLLPFILLYLWFVIDDKYHTKKDVQKFFEDIPFIGEIPFLEDPKVVVAGNTDRSILAESVRMVLANLKFVLSSKENKCTVLISTSTIKGEGKTLVANNIANTLKGASSKVLLVGADLRNPQIHTFLNIDKNVKGLSDYLHLKDSNWQNYLLNKSDDLSLDYLLSGTIPPNPNELLSSQKFSDFINEAKNHYDYIIIDTAPCLLVSDTLLISDLADLTIYSIRSNYSSNKLHPFIQDLHSKNKLNNMCLLLNAVGNSSAYGYKYSYQYGYKYLYNYGYGYGYSEEN